MMQPLIRKALRQTLRLAVKPVLKPWVPKPLQRRWVDLFSAVNPVAPGTRCTTLDLAGVAVEVVVPARHNRTVVLYLHGGAYCIGSSRTHRGLTSHLALFSQAAVWVPEYRLAPECPYPAALEDALKVYQSILDRGFDPGRIIVAGDSAGGGLALALAIKLRERHMPLPAALCLLSPWLDLGLESPHVFPEGWDPLLSKAWLADCARAYLNGREAQTLPVSPWAADLCGLPPVLIQVASDEILLEDARRLERQLGKVGVEVSYQEFEALWHVFQLHAGWLSVADEALHGVAGFMRRQVQAAVAARSATAV